MQPKKDSKKTASKPQISTVEKQLEKLRKSKKMQMIFRKSEWKEVGKTGTPAEVATEGQSAMTPLPEAEVRVRRVTMHKAYLTEHPQDRTQPTFAIVLAYTAEHALKKLTRAFPFQRVTQLSTEDSNVFMPAGIRALCPPSITLVE